MSRRRRLRRRLFWACLLFGFVLLYAAVSALRACVWCRDVVVGTASRLRRWQLGVARMTDITTRQGKGGSVYSKVTLIGVVAAVAMAFAAPAAWGDSWGADRLAQAKQEAQHAASSNPDWFERYVAAHSIREPVGDDHFRDSPDTAPVSGTSGTEADWPQIGLGLGFGVVLALGVFLAVRPTRVRPLPR